MPIDTEQDLEITSHGFLASPITDNIREMDDGSLVIENCPIARTGWQQYQVKDLPQQAARDMGVDLSDPNASIDLYRPESEVFDPEFIASLEGRPVTDNHPPDWVTPQNYNRYAQGHIQNVRRGDERLDDGEWPLVADLVISAEPLVSKVRNKQAREISLGYDYAIRKAGDRIEQCDMVGNHNAVVPKGRAGDDVRIMDSADGGAVAAVEAPVTTVSTEDAGGSKSFSGLTLTTKELAAAESPPPHVAPPEPEASPPGSGNGHAAATINAVQPTKKEKPKVKNNLLHIFGLGLRAKAADAETSPEELAEMAADVGKVKDTDPDLFEVTEGRDGKRGKDGTRRGKDAPTIDPVDKDIEPADDKRRAMHDALDKLYDGKVKDTDIGELKALFDQYLGEEAAEPEHQTEDADPAELEELLGAGEAPDAEDTEAEPGEEPGPSGEENLEDAGEEPGGEAECAHCGTMHDAENCPSCGCMDKKTRAKDRARAADGVAATLRMFRPFVARSNDQAMKKVFNTALGTLTKRSRARVGDYGAFAGAARTRSKDVGHDPNPTRRRAADASQPTQDEKLQAYYDERLKGGK